MSPIEGELTAPDDSLRGELEAAFGGSDGHESNAENVPETSQGSASPDGTAIVSEPAREREPMNFTEVYLAQVSVEDFRKNPRGELGTRTATLHREGILKLRGNWIYRDKLA